MPNLWVSGFGWIMREGRIRLNQLRPGRSNELCDFPTGRLVGSLMQRPDGPKTLVYSSLLE